MGTSSGSEFHHQQSPQMLQTPRQQTSLSLVSANILQEQFHDSPSESASSRETADDKLYMENEQLRHISNSDKMSLRDVARERVDLISESMQHLPDEFLEKLKIELRVMLQGYREEFLFLQKLVQSRTDLTDKTLIGAHRIQLEILVAIKSGIQAFLHPSVTLSQASLSEVFLYKRCRNIACGSLLPAEDCNCEPCAMTNGFCNICMCVICNKFDFEGNTCRWIGCDQCSHWTHMDCAIHNGLIGACLG